eukprot:gene33095-40841_t
MVSVPQLQPLGCLMKDQTWSNFPKNDQINSLVPFILDLNMDGILHQYDRSRNFSCTVVRDGQSQQMDVSKLVYGDIVVLQAGQMIPADLRLVESQHMAIDG